MPTPNRFQHQSYESVPAGDAFELLTPESVISVDSESFSAVLQSAGAKFRKHNVTHVILVHGTMAGTDALGWYAHWQRVFPALSEKLRHTYKHVIDSLSGDKGNYTQAYAETLSEGLNRGNEVQSQEICVDLFNWSSENHHLGRANAAVCLAEHILKLKTNCGRVQLWGHSHAGNVFALLSNLFGHNKKEQKLFFDSSRHFTDSSGRVNVGAWLWLEDALSKDLDRPKLDIVTFGTPVRYGWDAGGLENLLHFVNHIPHPGIEPYLSKFPGTAAELANAFRGEFGDFIQQTFVARTDLTPAIWSWPAWKANRSLRNLLESSELKNKRFWRFKQAKRVAESGHSLLVDYSVDPTAKDVAGHAVYTQFDWMAFHVREIASRMAPAAND